MSSAHYPSGQLRKVWYDVVWCGVVWCAVWHDVVNMVWYGMIWCGMIWIVWCGGV